MQPCDVTRLVVALDPEAHVREIFLEHYGLRGREAICFQDHVKFVLLVLSEQDVEAPAYAILRNDFETRRSFSPLAAETKSPEHGIVGKNCGGGAKRATVTEIYLARVVPGPSVMG